MHVWLHRLLVLGAALSCSMTSAVLIWREGEQPSSSAVKPHPWWYDQVTTNALCGGAWLSHFDGGSTGEASYAFIAPTGAAYTFWLRANPAGTLEYQLDGGAWQAIDWSAAVGRRNIARDGKNDLRYIAWVKVGTLTLAAGEHTLAFRMLSANSNHGALDAFVLSTTPFKPRGTRVPAATAAAPMTWNVNDTWAFAPLPDPFSSNALFDLRSLNESYAGEHGFIGLAPDGMSFVRGDAQPIRFWSVVAGPGKRSFADMFEHCRLLAKLGVNMARIHAGLCVATNGARITDIDDEELDQIFRYVAAAKSNGIYLTISPYWAHQNAPRSWGLDGYDDQAPWGVLFFNEHFQTGYMAWAQALYTRTNPYTGVALKDEPAVAIVQVKNEDSLLFWTFDRLAAPQKKLLRRKFGAWLAQRYGTLAKARAAWGKATHAEDNVAAGEMGFQPTWLLTQPATDPAMACRLRDQLEFIATTQRAFYEKIGAYYQRTLGCKQLVNAMNWRSADPVLLDDVERWTYAGNNVIALNRYTGVIHVGENNGYRVDPGHLFFSRSNLRYPGELPTAVKQVAGAPFIITECSWVHPTAYQSEGPLLAAAYMSLTGVDSLYWFAIGNEPWLLDPRRMFWPVDTSYAIDKWSCAVPELQGQFPANALAYRRGYIARADQPVVYEERSLSNLWRRTVPIIAEEGKFDPVRDQGAFAAQSPIKQDVDRLAFLVGPVHVGFDGNERNSRVTNLNAYIDSANNRVRGITGEIELDYKTGLCRVVTPKYQAVGGFLKQAGGVFNLRDVTIVSSNDYATIVVTALDDLPLDQSRKVLVQVGTVARMNGWSTEPTLMNVDGRYLPGEKILNTGTPPWCVANTRATLTIKNPQLGAAMLLDVGAYPARPVPVQCADGALTLTLPLNTMYLVLHPAPAPPPATAGTP
jgi:hypothetical protein